MTLKGSTHNCTRAQTDGGKPKLNGGKPKLTGVRPQLTFPRPHPIRGIYQGYGLSGPLSRWPTVVQHQPHPDDQSFKDNSPFMKGMQGELSTILSPNLVAKIVAKMLCEAATSKGGATEVPLRG